MSAAVGVFRIAPTDGNMVVLDMRILGTGILAAYVKSKPRARTHVLAFRALVSASSWRQLKDVELQFGHVATFNPPDRLKFEFVEEDLRIEMRVSFALGLVLVVMPIAKHDKEKKMNDPIRPIR